MNVTIPRAAGWCGKAVAVDVLCNKRTLFALRENESRSVALQASDFPATFIVRMQNAIVSPAFVVRTEGSAMHLQCGARLWPLFDFFNMAMVAPSRMFFLRPADFI